MHALPILCEFTKQLETRYTPTDRRWEFLRNFRTAGTIMLDRLDAIQKADVISKYESPIVGLITLLEDLLDDGLISLVKPEVSLPTHRTAVCRHSTQSLYN
jgi:hypothetical protein